MARRGADELLLAGELELDRRAGLDHGERHDVFDQHFLLGAEAATHALAEHADFCRIEAENLAQRPPREKRRLRARANIEPTRFIEPADRAVRFQMGMLNARGDIGGLVHDVGLGKAFVDIADMAVDLGHDISLWVVDAGLRPLVVEDRRAGLHRGFRIEHRRKQFVIDLELAATGFGGCLAFGNHRSDPLADEADDVIQHGGVIGIAAFILVSRARIELSWRVFPGQNGTHARHRQCGAPCGSI